MKRKIEKLVFDNVKSHNNIVKVVVRTSVIEWIKIWK